MFSYLFCFSLLVVFFSLSVLLLSLKVVLVQTLRDTVAISTGGLFFPCAVSAFAWDGRSTIYSYSFDSDEEKGQPPPQEVLLCVSSFLTFQPETIRKLALKPLLYATEIADFLGN